MIDGTQSDLNQVETSYEGAHPSPLTYAKIAVLLGAITAIEVGIFYVESLSGVIIPIFLILSAVKFAMVALFYMHLKFDHRLLSGFFAGGLLLAVSVFIALLTLFGALTGKDSIESSIITAHTSSIESPTNAVTTQPSEPVISGGQLFISKACGSCHALENVPGAIGNVGPQMDGIADRASSRVQGLTAKEYIEQSILDPVAFVVEDFMPLMPSLRATMTDQEFEVLVSYLLTLKQ